MQGMRFEPRPPQKKLNLSSMDHEQNTVRSN